MRVSNTIVLSVALFALAGGRLPAQAYLSKEGMLAQPLQVTQLQGGFAGFTGMQYTIAPDGSWTAESIFRQKKTLKSKGKLSEKDLMKLASILERFDLAGLPAKSGKQPGANPHTITFQFGKLSVSHVGQTPPRLDSANSTATVESRCAGIWRGVVELLAPPSQPKKKRDAEPGK